MRAKSLLLLLLLLASPAAWGAVRKYNWRALDASASPTTRIPNYYVGDTKADLPVGGPSGDLGYALDVDLLYYYTGAAWVLTGAPDSISVWTRVEESGLGSETVMGALATGIVVNTTTTGAPTIYAGSTCGAGTKATATSAAGALTCSAVSLTADVSGDLPFGNVAQIGTDRVLGRDTAATGDIEELTVGGGIAFSGAGGLTLASIPDSAMATSYSGAGACGASTWASTLNDAAAPTCTQPGFSDISGLVALAQITDDAASGKCLLSGGAGAPAWTACPGGGSTPTGTGFRHVTAGAEDAASVLVTLTSATHVAAGQGTTVTVLHGNAAGQASFGAVDLANDTGSALPLAKLADDASSGLCLVSGGGGGDPNYATCPGGGGGLSHQQVMTRVAVIGGF